MEKRGKPFQNEFAIAFNQMIFTVSLFFKSIEISLLDNTVCYIDGRYPSEQTHNRGNHTAMFQPRNYKNIYHFLEGSSQFIRLALHPQLFPPVCIISFLFIIIIRYRILW